MGRFEEEARFKVEQEMLAKLRLSDPRLLGHRAFRPQTKLRKGNRPGLFQELGYRRTLRAAFRLARELHVEGEKRTLVVWPIKPRTVGKSKARSWYAVGVRREPNGRDQRRRERGWGYKRNGVVPF
jgi:hypothetical protein